MRKLVAIRIYVRRINCTQLAHAPAVVPLAEEQHRTRVTLPTHGVAPVQSGADKG